MSDRYRCVCGVPAGKCRKDRDPKDCNHDRVVFAGKESGTEANCHACGKHWNSPADFEKEIRGE